MNRFDRVSRLLALEEPWGFFNWCVTEFSQHLRFRRWLRTQTAPEPADPEFVADTIAELRELARVAPPWLYLVEWQTEPDPRMFGRLLQELGQAWENFTPEDNGNPGDSYQLSACVINLTGTPASLPASRRFVLPGPDGNTLQLQVRERWLSQEPASETLERIARGEIGRNIGSDKSSGR